jgi:hypothetical protein
LRDLRIKAVHELSDDRCMTTVEFEGLPRFEPNRLSYEIVGPDAPRQAPNGNFAIAAALPTAMSLGRPLHLVGEADGDFLAQMEEYMAAWCRWRPDLFQPVAISADTEVAPRTSSSGSAIMAFSGGLDSTFALARPQARLTGRRALDIEAAVLIQGFDIPLDDARALGIARAHVQAILESYGVRLNIVRTNWQKPFCVKWGMTHVLGITAVLHQFHRQFASAVIADDVPYESQVTPWSSNAITNQMLGCGAFPIRPAGAAWSRTEKAGAVASNPAVLQHLRVCYERPELGENCGVCEKCVRTKLNFHAVGIRPNACARRTNNRRRYPAYSCPAFRFSRLDSRRPREGHLGGDRSAAAGARRLGAALRASTSQGQANARAAAAQKCPQTGSAAAARDPRCAGGVSARRRFTSLRVASTAALIKT